MDPCDGSQQDEIADYYNCLKDNKVCPSSATTIQSSGCLDNISVGAATCMADVD